MEETQHILDLPLLLLPSRIKKSLSFLVLFFPTSILILITLILLACNAFSIFCLHLPPHLTVPAPPAKPISAFSKSSPLHLTVEEEIVPSLNKTHPELQPLFPHPSPSCGSPKGARGSRPNFSILRQTPRSARFSARAKEFFGGSSSAACDARFFMTWISSAESFGRRELLAVESVFKSHPRACLLIISSSLDSKRGAHLLQPFSSRGFRIAAVSPNFTSIFKGTSADFNFSQQE